MAAKFVCRPSKRNRSPYVADVHLDSERREAIAHVPAMDMGGKLVEDAQLLLKPATDKKNRPVGKDAVSPKYGTPKCEFITQLLRVDESSLGYPPTWVGAHPALGEKVAEQLLMHNLLGPSFPAVARVDRQVCKLEGTDPSRRFDFLVHHQDAALRPRIVEVKMVVDTDYAVDAKPERAKCVYTSDRKPYQRAAIFPYGSCKQKGPDGEKVVSARAIHHVRELTRVTENQSYDTTILFVVVRGDATHFRPNHECCPSFCKYLHHAHSTGVQVLAKQVWWGGEGSDIGKCFEGGLLDIRWPHGFDFSVVNKHKPAPTS
jgi:DNA-binding sugar fermentation-stimulating protein